MRFLSTTCSETLPSTLLYCPDNLFVLILHLKMEVLLKVGCLPYVAEKQPSILLINLGRKWT